MRFIAGSPWRAALFVLLLAILPVWTALLGWREHSRRAETLLFERSADVVTSQLGLLTTRRIGWQNALRMRLSNRPHRPEMLLDRAFAESSLMETSQNCDFLAYGALENGRVTLMWHHPMSAADRPKPGEDLLKKPELEVLLRQAMATPARIVAVQQGDLLIVAMTVGNTSARDPHGWLLGWWSLTAMCDDAQLPLVNKDHALTARPLDGPASAGGRTAMIGEGGAAWTAEISKDAGFDELFPRVSESALAMAGGGFALLLALLAGIGVRSLGLRAALDLDREMLEMKDHLLHSVSHEFRTPLSVILSSTELLESYAERLTPERRADALNQIRDSTARMNDMVGQVLLLGRMQARRIPAEPRPTDTAALAREVAKETEIAFHSRCVIAVDAPENLEVTLDPVLLRAVLGNLLSNAVKFSPEKSTVEFTVEKRGGLRFRIRDHGCGIGNDELAHLSQPFFRSPSAGDIPGTGLGLTIALKAAELLGATLGLESHATGTTATLTFP